MELINGSWCWEGSQWLENVYIGRSLWVKKNGIRERHRVRRRLYNNTRSLYV